MFRISYLGEFNDLSLIGSLDGEKMGFSRAGVPYMKGGGAAAMDYVKRR